MSDRRIAALHWGGGRGLLAVAVAQAASAPLIRDVVVVLEVEPPILAPPTEPSVRV